jgi:AcrR family transcriptional regulator
MLLLDTAAQVFAEAGYEAATTNAIAARAGMSPGSLYQFFPNKQAISDALAERYEQQLQAAYDAAFTPDLAALPLDALLNHVVDPLAGFYIANPGFQALFAGPHPPPPLATTKQHLHAAEQRHLDAILTARAPGLTPGQRARTADICVRIFTALLPLLAAAGPEQRETALTDLKKVLRGYLAPIIGDQASTRPAGAGHPAAGPAAGTGPGPHARTRHPRTGAVRGWPWPAQGRRTDATGRH